MSRIVSDLIYRLQLEQEELTKGLKKASADVEALSKKFTETGKKLTLGLTVPILGAGAAMIKLASESEDSINAVNVVFKEGAQAILEYGKTADEAAGLSSAAFNDVANSFGVLLSQTTDDMSVVADNTIELTQRAADLASLLGGSTKEAALALGAALRGESEPARRYGIILSEAAIKAKAMELGIGGATAELTEAEKVQVRYNLILEQSARAQGDFANTNNDAKNSAQVLKAQISNLATEFGEQLLPLVVDVLTGLRDLTSQFADLSDEQKKAVLVTAGVTAAIGPMLIGVGQAITAVSRLKEVFSKIPAGGGPVILALTAIAAAVGLVAAGMAKAKREAKAFSDAISGAADLETIQQVIKAKQKEIEYQTTLIQQNEALGVRGKQAADAAKEGLVRLQKEYAQLVANYNGKKLTLDITEKQREAEIVLAEAARKKAEAEAAAALARASGDTEAIAATDEQLAQADEELAKAEEIAKARADAYGDYIVALALIKDASKTTNDEIAEDEKLTWKERAAYAQQFASQLSTIYSQITSNQLTELDQQYAAEKARIEANITDEAEKTAAIEALEKKLAYEKAVIQRKQAIADKAASLFEIGINTASAIVKALPNVILAGIVGGLGLAQAATVLATPLPEVPSFAQGGSFIVPPGFDNDSFALPAAMVQSGERVTVETPEQQAAAGTINLYVGTLVADKAGLRELDRKLRNVGSTETARRG